MNKFSIKFSLFLLLGCLVFILDSYIPPGFDAWILYWLLILPGAWNLGKKSLLILIFFYSAFIVIEIFTSPEAQSLIIYRIINRLFFLIILNVTAFIAYKLRQKYLTVRKLRDELSAKKIELELSNKNIKDIVDNISDAFFALDSNLKITYINKAAQKLGDMRFNTSFFNKNIFELYPELKDGLIERKVKKVLKSQESVHFEFEDSIYKRFYNISVYPSGDKGLSVFAQDNTKQQETQHKLQHALEERELLIKEIHHRVKNNLQIIISIISLQIEHTADQKLKKALTDTINRIKSISTLHSKLYTASFFSKVNLSEYLKDIISTLIFSYNYSNVKVNFELVDIEMDINNAIWLGIFLNELVSNSFKYAFTDNQNGEIYIRLKRENGKIHLMVKDNGSGYPADLIERYSLGYQIITAICDQLNGTLVLENRKGAFTELIFPEISDQTDL